MTTRRAKTSRLTLPAILLAPLALALAGDAGVPLPGTAGATGRCVAAQGGPPANPAAPFSGSGCVAPARVPVAMPYRR